MSNNEIPRPGRSFMDGVQKREYLQIRRRCKMHGGQATSEEIKWLRWCRRWWPDTCRELDAQIAEEALRSVNPLADGL